MNNAPYTHLFKALSFAANQHRHQRRKSKDAAPYINHPIEVAEMLVAVGQIDDVPTLMAAVLHDTIEDTDTTSAELEALFGRDVTALVLELSDDKTLPSQERKRLQIEHALTLSERAKIIKIADKTSNVRDIGAEPPADWDTSRCLAYFDWAENVVAGCRGVNRRLEELFDASLAESRARRRNA